MHTARRVPGRGEGEGEGVHPGGCQLSGAWGGAGTGEGVHPGGSQPHAHALSTQPWISCARWARGEGEAIRKDTVQPGRVVMGPLAPWSPLTLSVCVHCG
jgi:hypothetical protein